MSNSLSRTQKLLTLTLSLASLLLAGGDRAEARNTEKRPISYTVGCIEYRNWESNLVRNNPNLRHYHWNPIYANVQSTRLVGPPPPPPERGKSPPKKNGAPPGNPKNVIYTAAKKRPLFYKKNVSVKHSVYRPSFYKKPVHTAPQRTTGVGTNIAYKHIAPQLSHRNTNIQLSNRDINGKLVASNPVGRITVGELEARRKALQAKLMPYQPTPAIALAKRLPPNRNVNGTLAHRNVEGQLMHHDVQGELVARAVSGAISPSRISDDAGAFAYESYAAARVDNYNGQLTKSNVNGRVAPTQRNY